MSENLIPHLKGKPKNRSTYINWHCRCVDCTSSHTQYNAFKREKRKQEIKDAEARLRADVEIEFEGVPTFEGPRKRIQRVAAGVHLQAHPAWELDLDSAVCDTCQMKPERKNGAPDYDGWLVLIMHSDDAPERMSCPYCTIQHMHGNWRALVANQHPYNVGTVLCG